MQLRVHVQISARSQLTGRVLSTNLGSIMAEVVVEVGTSDIVAAITRSSVETLGLKEGDTVRVIIKSTKVMIAKEAEGRASRRFLMAEAAGITLAALLRGRSVNIYSHPERLRQ
jgi:molybdopterin-binding protein